MPSIARLYKISPTAALLFFTVPAFSQIAGSPKEPTQPNRGPQLAASAQVTVTQNFFTTTDHVKLRYLEAGQGQAILLIPGWLMPADIWEPQFRDLSKDFHVIALDPRCQGQSDLTPQGNDPLRRSQDIQELLQHLQLDSVVLAGWALGAFDTLAYLKQFGSDNLKAIVLVDSPLGAPSAPPTQRSPFLTLFQTNRPEANQNYVWGLFKKKQKHGFYQTLIDSAARVPTDTALAILDNASPGDNWEPGPKALRSVPILYAITPKYSSQAAYLQQVAPGTKVELFEGSGHALFVDDADHFNSALRNFLQQSSATPIATPGTPTAAKIAPKTVGAPASQASSTAANPSLTPFLTSTPTPEVVMPVAIPPTPTPTSLSFFERLQKGLAALRHAEEPTSTPITRPKHKEASKETPTESASPSLTPTVPTPTATPLPPTLTPRPVPPTVTWTSTPLPVPSATPTALPPQASPVLEAAQPNPVLEAPSKAFRPTQGKQPFYSVPVQDGYFTTSDHVKLHYLESGKGLTLIFIPGWLLPAEIWKAQLEDLSDDYHVVALDPRSQGRSEITPKGDEPIRQARDIHELMDHLKVDSAVLIGWSHGAFQVLAYMGQFGTDRLYAVALVDSALGAASSPTISASRTKFLQGFQTNRVAATRSFVWGLFKRHPSAEFIRLLSDSALKTPTDIAMTLMNSAFPGESYQPSLVTMREVPFFYAVTPKFTSQSEYLTAVAPLSKVEFFQNTGHALFVDDSEHFNNALRDFLKKAAVYKAGLPEPKHKPVPTPTPYY